MMLQTANFFFASMLLSIFYFHIFVQTQNRTPISNILDFNTHTKSIDRVLTSTGGINMKGEKTYFKRCFRLSWKRPFKLHTYIEFETGVGKNRTTSLNRDICNRFVTIGNSKGRMGNQMFEIASVLGLAFSYDIIPVFPKHFPLDKYIELPNIYEKNSANIEDAANCVCCKAAVFCNCKKFLNSATNVTIHGYLQSWKYFYDIEHMIRQIFTLKSNHITNAREFLTNVTTHGYHHVCIHVRRGDFIGQSHRGYTTANASFIEKAKEFYIKKYPKVDFVLASDDKKWCRENIKDVAISPFISAGDDMALMKVSDHVIVTSGTFGWWGAWLSGGTTVYFKGYPGIGLLSTYNVYDYYPPHWIGLS